MRLTADRVLRALSRFDSAKIAEVAEALGHSAHRTVWWHLQNLVAEGFASRDGERKQFARYAVTDAGRALIAETAV